jgi:hypothetical protein
MKDNVKRSRIYKWLMGVFGWLWINDNGKTIFDKSDNPKPLIPQNKQAYPQNTPAPTGTYLVITSFGARVMFEYEDTTPESPPSSSSRLSVSPPPERHR